MAHALPLTKLAGLLVKTLAKPLSKGIKHQFSRFEATKNLLAAIGQTNHRITSRMTIWASGYRVRSIAPLEEEKAIKDGAEFIGESFIFTVSGCLVVWEYGRSAEAAREKQEQKRLAIKAEQTVLKAKLHALDVRLKAVENAVKAQTDTLLGITAIGGKRKYVEPPAHELVPIDDDDDDDSSSGNEAQDVQGGDATTQPPSSSSGEKRWWKIW